MIRDADDTRERYALLLGAIVGEDGVITIDGLASRFELSTSVRLSVRRRYLEAYLNGISLPRPAWAYEIGQCLPCPWTSGPWGLWSAGCFIALIQIIVSAAEITNDRHLSTRFCQLWHFLDALQYVKTSALDGLPSIRLLDKRETMPTDPVDMNMAEIFEALYAGGMSKEYIVDELYLVMCRQIAKRRLKQSNAELAVVFERAWWLAASGHRGIGERPFWSDQELRNAQVAHELDLGDETLIPVLQFLANTHLHAAERAARNTKLAVETRADRVIDSMQLWAESHNESMEVHPIHREITRAEFAKIFQ